MTIKNSPLGKPGCVSVFYGTFFFIGSRRHKVGAGLKVPDVCHREHGQRHRPSPLWSSHYANYQHGLRTADSLYATISLMDALSLNELTSPNEDTSAVLHSLSSACPGPAAESNANRKPAIFPRQCRRQKKFGQARAVAVQAAGPASSLSSYIIRRGCFGGERPR